MSAGRKFRKIKPRRLAGDDETDDDGAVLSAPKKRGWQKRVVDLDDDEADARDRSAEMARDMDDREEREGEIFATNLDSFSCERCKGSGTEHGGEDCRECGGTGLLM